MLTKFIAPYFVQDFNPCNFMCRISDLKWFLIKGRGNNNSSCMISSHQCCCLWGTSCLFYSLPCDFLLYNTRLVSTALLCRTPWVSTFDLCFAALMVKFTELKRLPMFTTWKELQQFLNMCKSWACICNRHLLIHILLTGSFLKWKSQVNLDAITNALAYSIVSLISRLSLHWASLLIYRNHWRQIPCFLPNVVEPLEEFMHLTVWTLGSRRRTSDWILSIKDARKQLDLACSIRSVSVLVKVIPLDWILCLRPQFRCHHWQWIQSIQHDNTMEFPHIIHCQASPFPSKGMFPLTSISNPCLHIYVHSPIWNQKFYSLISLHINLFNQLKIVAGSQRK